MGDPIAYVTPGYALNSTRQAFLATELRVAESFGTRLRGLLKTKAQEFGFGRGLWIHPSKGVHAIGMRYAIDAVYLDRDKRVIHIQQGLKPWRLGPIRREAQSVLELPAGAVERTNTQLGDQVQIRQAALAGAIEG